MNYETDKIVVLDSAEDVALWVSTTDRFFLTHWENRGRQLSQTEITGRLRETIAALHNYTLSKKGA